MPSALLVNEMHCLRLSRVQVNESAKLVGLHDRGKPTSDLITMRKYYALVCIKKWSCSFSNSAICLQ